MSIVDHFWASEPRTNPSPSYDHGKLVTAVHNRTRGEYAESMLQNMSYADLHALAVKLRIRS